MSDPNTSFRDSLILSFFTQSQKTRSMNISDPAPNLDPLSVIEATNRLIQANIFDENVGTGAPIALRSAALERVETTVLF